MDEFQLCEAGRKAYAVGSLVPGAGVIYRPCLESGRDVGFGWQSALWWDGK